MLCAMNLCTRTSEGLIITQTIVGLSEELLNYLKKRLSLPLLIEETLSDAIFLPCIFATILRNLVQGDPNIAALLK